MNTRGGADRSRRRSTNSAAGDRGGSALRVVELGGTPPPEVFKAVLVVGFQASRVRSVSGVLSLSRFSSKCLGVSRVVVSELPDC